MSFVEELFRNVETIARSIADERATLRMWVVDEVGGQVRLATAIDQLNGYEPMQRRFPRLAGEPFAPGTEVRVEQQGHGYLVLGPVQAGAGAYKQNRLTFKNSGTTVGTGQGGLNAGTGIVAAPSNGGADVTLSVDQTTVQAPLSVRMMGVQVRSNPSIDDRREGLVVEAGGAGTVSTRVDFGSATETADNKVARAHLTQRRMDVQEDAGDSVRTNPAFVRFGSGLAAAASGEGVLVTAVTTEVRDSGTVLGTDPVATDYRSGLSAALVAGELVVDAELRAGRGVAFTNDTSWVSPWHWHHHAGANTVTYAMNTDTVTGIVMPLAQRRRVDRILLNVTASIAGGQFQVGLYRLDGAGLAGTLIATSPVQSSATTGQRTWTLDQVLDAGMYLVVVLSANTFQVPAVTGVLDTLFDSGSFAIEGVGVGTAPPRRRVVRFGRSWASGLPATLTWGLGDVLDQAVPLVVVRTNAA